MWNKIISQQKYPFFFVVLSLFFSNSIIAQTINTKYSYVSFKAKNMEVKTVKGSISDMQGEVHWNEKDFSSVRMQACLGVKTISTGTPKRDEHLLEEDFFDAEKYPNICFVSTQITEENKNYIVTGKLTIRNITKEVKIPFTVAKNLFSGTFTINRFDFDLGKDSNTFMISEEIEITIKCLIHN